MSLATYAQQLPANTCGIVCTYDASGNRAKRVSISRFTANGNTIDFDLSTSPAGIYFIRIDDTGNTLVKKVVKQ